ncbi:hypothetical protein Tco_0545495 [Tanacetum coccineum]
MSRGKAPNGTTYPIGQKPKGKTHTQEGLYEKAKAANLRTLEEQKLKQLFRRKVCWEELVRKEESQDKP